LSATAEHPVPPDACSRVQLTAGLRTVLRELGVSVANLAKAPDLFADWLDAEADMLPPEEAAIVRSLTIEDFAAIELRAADLAGRLHCHARVSAQHMARTPDMFMAWLEVQARNASPETAAIIRSLVVQDFVDAERRVVTELRRSAEASLGKPVWTFRRGERRLENLARSLRSPGVSLPTSPGGSHDRAPRRQPRRARSRSSRGSPASASSQSSDDDPPHARRGQLLCVALCFACSAAIIALVCLLSPAAAS
jgi:hypothetical protein